MEPMTSYEGLLLDFGGVVTTDFFDSLGAHCERLGLPHDSFRNLVAANPEGRELYHQVERGELSQPDFEQKIAQLLGVQPAGLIQGLLADLRPEPLMAEAVATARTAGIRVGVITNSWGTVPYDPYAGGMVKSCGSPVRLITRRPPVRVCGWSPPFWVVRRW